MKTLIFSVIAIYGRDVPAFDKYEDIKAIALNLIHKLSGVEVIDSQVKDCHRLGKKILVSFVYAGACSPINEIVYDKKAMHKAATWINIHQCPHDRYIAFVARRMKKAGILSFVGTTFGSLTRVGQNGQKYTINSLEDLQQLTSQPLSRFQKGGAELNDSAINMER